MDHHLFRQKRAQYTTGHSYGRTALLVAMALLLVTASGRTAYDPAPETPPVSTDSPSGLEAAPAPEHVRARKKWPPSINYTYKGGNDRHVSRLSGMIPLWQSPDSLLLGDIRFVSTDDDTFEGNLGLGYRQVLLRSTDSGHGLILGAYGFYDRRCSEYERYYNQATVGGEILTRFFELRGNAYIPESRSHVVARRSVRDAVLRGTTVVSRTSTLEARERALPGFDLEAGCGLELGTFGSIWAYAGYFRFATAGAPAIEGPRIRLHYELADPFGLLGSTFSAGYELRHDQVRGTDSFAVIQVTIPLGRVCETEEGYPKLAGIDRRMLRPIMRDVDVVTFVQDINDVPGTHHGPDVVTREEGPVRDPATGATVDVYFVDANGSALGTGTRDNPMTIAQAEAVSGPSDIIFLLSGDGFIDVAGAGGGTLTLRQNQQLAGVGDNGTASINLPTGMRLNITDPNGRPLLFRVWTGTDIPPLTLASGNTIQGIMVAGGTDGMRGNNITGFTAEDTWVLSTGSEGIYLFDVQGPLRFSNLLIDNTFSSGIWIQNTINSRTTAFSIQDCTIQDTGGGGIMILNDANGSVFTGTISDNTVTGNAGNGIALRTMGTALTTVAVEGSTISTNQSQGMLAIVMNTSTLNATVRNTRLENNNTDAIAFWSLGGTLCTNIDATTPNQPISLQNPLAGTFDAERRDTLSSRNNNVPVNMAGVINDVPEGTCPTP